MQLFFFPSTRNRLYMPRARNCVRSRQRAGFDTASMMLKPACNGKPRRKSSTMLQEWPPAPPPFNGLRIFTEGQRHAPTPHPLKMPPIQSHAARACACDCLGGDGRGAAARAGSCPWMKRKRAEKEGRKKLPSDPLLMNPRTHQRPLSAEIHQFQCHDAAHALWTCNNVRRRHARRRPSTSCR